MQFRNLKSTFQRLSWQVYERPLDSLRAVFSWILTTLYQAFFLVTWLLVGMLLRGLELVSTLVEFVGLTVRLGVEKYNTQVLSLFSRNSRAQSAVALRMELGVGVLLSTSQSGIKKLRTSLFSKITKGQKTTG